MDPTHHDALFAVDLGLAAAHRVTVMAGRRCRLTEMDLTAMLSVAGVGQLPVSQLPAFIKQTHAMADPGNLLMQMCQVLLAMGEDELALEMQAKALAHRRVFRWIGHASPAIRLLAVMGPGSMVDNAPLDFVVDLIPVRLDLVFVSPVDGLPEELPDHDVLIVAIGESTASTALLAHVGGLLSGWPRPVLNRPDRIGRCARDALYPLMAHAAGLRVAPTRKIGRYDAPGLEFPLTIRPVDAHAGHGLAKVETAAEWAAYLDSRQETAFYVSSFLDYRSADGLYRKYRVALIDGRPHVCHLAISAHWMVHYRTAGMHDDPDKRLEEAAQMDAFERGFAVRHAAALQAIADALELEYVVIDCAEAGDGQLVLFEADTRGWIHASDPIDLFPYKPRVMQKAFDAFLEMLMRRLPAP